MKSQYDYDLDPTMGVIHWLYVYKVISSRGPDIRRYVLLTPWGLKMILDLITRI